jgi:ubiquinone/menaquinone biosynthesis C-methylase UbiE
MIPTNHSDLKNQNNVDVKVVEDFGREWKAFNQQALPEIDLEKSFDQYFHIFPFQKISSNSVGFDMGCGSGRWAQLMSQRVGQLNCIDPSQLALEQAKNNLDKFSNCTFECASVSDTKLENASQDFGYCLGVLHHIPDTLEGLISCASKLKKGAPFLLYLYYRFDNKPLWFSAIWKLSDLVRQFVSKLPFPVKLVISQIIAFFIYLPLAKISLLLEKLNFNVDNFPLSDYRNKPLYFLRTDALDRFGTKLEKRFTKLEISDMMKQAGFIDVSFSNNTPYWVVIGAKS